MDDDAFIDYWITYQTASGSTEKSIRERIYALRGMLKRTGKTFLTVTRHDLIRDRSHSGAVDICRHHFRAVLRE